MMLRCDLKKTAGLMISALKYIYNPFYTFEKLSKLSKWASCLAALILLAIANILYLKGTSQFLCCGCAEPTNREFCLELQGETFGVRYVEALFHYALWAAVFFVVFRLFKLRPRLLEFMSLLTGTLAYLYMWMYPLLLIFIDYLISFHYFAYVPIVSAFVMLFIAIKNHFKLTFCKTLPPYIVFVLLFVLANYIKGFLPVKYPWIIL